MEVYPRLMAAQPGSVAGFVSDASFQDIGTPGDLLRTALELAAEDGRPDHPRWGEGVRVSESATVERSELWRGVIVENDAHVSDCVVADGVRIPAASHFERCAIVHAPDAVPRPDERRVGDLLIAPL
jgi:NDP-sugar pyrophosphorylase family protein